MKRLNPLRQRLAALGLHVEAGREDRVLGGAGEVAVAGHPLPERLEAPLPADRPLMSALLALRIARRGFFPRRPTLPGTTEARVARATTRARPCAAPREPDSTA